MTNYRAMARTNYFSVKDEQAFMDEMSNYEITLIARTLEDGTSLYGFIDNSSDGSGLDWSMCNEDGDEEDIFWIDIISKHLADGHVAIIMEVGSENYRWLNGWALAINNRGETREVNLFSIHDQATHLGRHITSVGDM